MKILPLNLITNYKTNLKNNNVKHTTSPLAYDSVSFSGKVQKEQSKEEVMYDKALQIQKKAKVRKAEATKILSKANKISSKAQKISNKSAELLKDALKMVEEYRTFDESDMLFRNQQGQKTSTYHRTFNSHTIIKYDKCGNPTLRIDADLDKNIVVVSEMNLKNTQRWFFENSQLMTYQKGVEDNYKLDADIEYYFNNGSVQQVISHKNDKGIKQEVYFFNPKEGFKKCQRSDYKRRELAYYFTDAKLTKTKDYVVNSRGCEVMTFDNNGVCRLSEHCGCNIANLFDDVIDEYGFDEKGKPAWLNHNGKVQYYYLFEKGKATKIY